MKNIVQHFTCIALTASLIASPAMARLWKPTPQQTAQDYAIISHNKGVDGRVIIQWLASPLVVAPTMQQLLDKYVVINVIHTRQAASGLTTWDDIDGVQVTDVNGQPLKEVVGDAIPPTFVGMIAQSEATMSQSTQGMGKVKWLVFEADGVNACGAGRLSVGYEGETYTFDTPMPGCIKP